MPRVRGKEGELQSVLARSIGVAGCELMTQLADCSGDGSVGPHSTPMNHDENQHTSGPATTCSDVKGIRRSSAARECEPVNETTNGRKPELGLDLFADCRGGSL